MQGKKQSKNISNISQERIRDEFFKILLSETPPSKGIKILEKMEILNIILPELVETIGFDQKKSPPSRKRTIFPHIMCIRQCSTNT